MPLFADAAPDIGQLTGPVGAVFGGVVLLLYVWDKITESRKKRKLADVEAGAAAAEADELPIRQFQRAARAAETKATKLEEKVERMEARLNDIQARHHDCEDRFARQEQHHSHEIAGLKAQNAGQQLAMDAEKATVAELLNKVARLEAALRSQNIATGSGPLPSLPEPPKG